MCPNPDRKLVPKLVPNLLPKLGLKLLYKLGPKRAPKLTFKLSTFSYHKTILSMNCRKVNSYSFHLSFANMGR